MGFNVPDFIPRRIDWKVERERIDLAEVIARESNRRAEIRKGRPWFVCPFHADKRPSLIVRKLDDGRQRWKCYGCGLKGDAVAFVMRIRSMTFPEAVAHLTGNPAPPGKSTTRPAKRPAPRPEPPPAAPSGMPEADALALVEAAERRLWTPEGEAALDYLTGPSRCLSHETIRAARLGWTPKAEGVAWKPPAVVIPWFAGGRLALVKVRPPDAWRERFPIERRPPKYLEAFRDPARLVCYPGPEMIRPGRPVVIVEGEFDALALVEALGELAGVVTLGSASARPDSRSLMAMLAAPRWLVATDADGAGDEAAHGWPARARRVRPPFKDWTEAKAAGVNLAQWWQDALTRERFLAKLQARGARLDGRVVHPEIGVGTVTGRVVYRNPGLQSLPLNDRLTRIGPVDPGRQFVRADYGQIEPRILLAILRRLGRIGWEAGDDLYTTLSESQADRDSVKIVVNRLINGGRRPGQTTGRLADFADAADEFRAALAIEAKTSGFVRTLTGRVIPLAADAENHGGKAVNRVVQGTAADIFNQAAIRIDRTLGETGSGAVAFVLFDEMWIETDPAAALTAAALVRSEMMTAALELGVSLPVHVEPEPEGPARFSRDQLSRWRWGPALDDAEPGIIIPTEIAP